MFGHEFRDKYFTLLEDGVLSVNHGSYGHTPTPVFDKYVQYIRNEYAYPDRYMLREQLPEYTEALQLISDKYLHCDYHNVALVENATTGVNTVLRSLKFNKGDRIVMASTVYGSCYNTVRFLAKRIGIVPVVVDLPYPLEDEEVVARFAKELPGSKLALFDAITLMPGVRVPFEKLTKLCKKHGVISLIDGAHSIGLIELDLGTLAPDFYVTNLHKWLYVPRGCAALYVNPQYHGEIQTMPISHSYIDEDVEPIVDDSLISKFHFIGTVNFASIASIKDAIEFREKTCGGEDAIAQYCQDLSFKSAKLAIAKWPFAQLLTNRHNSVIPPSMVNLIIPFKDLVSHYQLATLLDFNNKEALDKAHDAIDIMLMDDYKSRAPFLFHNGEVWMRFSCQIYNELSDYDYVTNAFGHCLKKYFGVTPTLKL